MFLLKAFVLDAKIRRLLIIFLYNNATSWTHPISSRSLFWTHESRQIDLFPIKDCHFKLLLYWRCRIFVSHPRHRRRTRRCYPWTAVLSENHNHWRRMVSRTGIDLNFAWKSYFPFCLVTKEKEGKDCDRDGWNNKESIKYYFISHLGFSWVYVFRMWRFSP